MISTPIVDEGTYMFDPQDWSGRWVITHPKNSYFPNESKMYDVCIESPNDPKGIMPIIDLGSFKKLNEAKLFIEKLHSENKTYFNLKA